MSWALASADLKARWRSILALAAGVLAFLLVLAGTYSALGGNAGIAKSLGGSNNRFFSAFAGSESADIFTPQGYLAFGFGHPLFLVLSLSLCVAMGAGAVAQDVETGRAELLYTAPVSRTRIVVARMGALAVAEVVVLGASAAGGLIGSTLSPSMSAVSSFVVLRILVQYIPLALLVAAAGLLASVVCRTRGAAVAATTGLVAGSYVINVIALLWTPIASIRHVDPFFYFQPTAAAKAVDWAHVAVLGVTAAAVLAIAVVLLGRRDLA